MNENEIVSVLRLGAVGLGFLLAFLAFRVLTGEQRREQPRGAMLAAAYVFMVFSLLICALITYKEVQTLSMYVVPSIDWTTESVNGGVMVQCLANGKKVGSPLSCNTYKTCSSLDGNRLFCAGTYYARAIEAVK
jgi:hypothetical protein